MRAWRLRFLDSIPDETVITTRKVVTTLIAIEGRGEGPDVDTLSDSPFMPS